MFYAYLQQLGEGCDYSIACGKKLIKLSAQSYAEAGSELREMIMEDKLKSITLLEVVKVEEMPVKSWYEEIELLKLEEQDRQEYERDVLEYERLKKRFG